MSLLGSWSEASFTHPRGAIQMAKNLSNALHTYFMSSGYPGSWGFHKGRDPHDRCTRVTVDAIRHASRQIVPTVTYRLSLYRTVLQPTGRMRTPKQCHDGPAIRASPGSAQEPLRLLFLEDNAADAELIIHELERAGMTIMAGRVNSAESFTAALHSFAPDLVVSDYSLAQFDSLAALEILRGVHPEVPFIIVSGALTGSQSVATVRAGADDIILKAYLSRLPTAINATLAMRRPIAKLTARQIEILKLVAAGHRTRDIARLLGISVKTVESHRGEVMERLRIHNAVTLARYAIRVGLIPLNFDPESTSNDRSGSH
jgi:DNA-binding NarL/FixJ family response regulator